MALLIDLAATPMLQKESCNIIVVVIVISEFLERHSKAERTRVADKDDDSGDDDNSSIDDKYE